MEQKRLSLTGGADSSAVLLSRHLSCAVAIGRQGVEGRSTAPFVSVWQAAVCHSPRCVF